MATGHAHILPEGVGSGGASDGGGGLGSDGGGANRCDGGVGGDRGGGGGGSGGVGGCGGVGGDRALVVVLVTGFERVAVVIFL